MTGTFDPLILFGVFFRAKCSKNQNQKRELRKNWYQSIYLSTKLGLVGMGISKNSFGFAVHDEVTL